MNEDEDADIHITQHDCGRALARMNAAGKGRESRTAALTSFVKAYFQIENEALVQRYKSMIGKMLSDRKHIKRAVRSGDTFIRPKTYVQS